MKVSKTDKAQILEAYLNKSISKEETALLLKDGINFPPIPWICTDPEKGQIEAKRRELVCRVFGITELKIEWI